MRDYNVNIMQCQIMVLNHILCPTVDGSPGVSEVGGVLTVTVKDGEDKKSDKSETPVNPSNRR